MTIFLTDRPPDRLRADGRDGEQHDEVLARSGEHSAALDAQAIRADSTVGSSPRDVEDTQPVIEDGVVADARRRARRRWAGYGIAAAVSALVLGAGSIMMLGGPSDARRTTVDPEHGGAAWPAPPADEAEVVAEWVLFHAGWAYIYDDGRVLWRTDGGRITQQRLSPEGLDLVREGEIDPAAFVLGRASIPADAWAEPVPIEYLPSNYAICAVDNSSGRGEAGPPADQIEARLPEPVRTQVAGTAGSFRHGDWGGTAVWIDIGASRGSDPVQTCFILGTDRARAVWAHTSADPTEPGADGVMQVGYYTFGTLTMTDGTTMQFWSLPILPHGVGGSWGG
jgi:hypothetical protein